MPDKMATTVNNTHLHIYTNLLLLYTPYISRSDIFAILD